MTPKGRMARNRARMPQERRSENGGLPPKNHHIGAKVTRETFEIIDSAAAIRGWPRGRVVEEGALLRAQQIMAEAVHAQSQVRRAMRRDKARNAALAKKQPKRHR